MKKIKLSIGIAALAFGAFAFTPAHKAPLATADYYTNVLGQPTTPYNPSEPCTNLNLVKCSATFTLDGSGNPIAGTATNVRTGPIAD